MATFIFTNVEFVVISIIRKKELHTIKQSVTVDTKTEGIYVKTVSQERNLH